MKTNRHELCACAAKRVQDQLIARGYKFITVNGSSFLSVESPAGISFNIKVTSLSSPNAWIIPEIKDKNTYFALVFQKDNNSGQIFILTHDEMETEKIRHINSRKRPIENYSNPPLERRGLSFKQPFNYEEKWSSLPK